MLKGVGIEVVYPNQLALIGFTIVLMGMSGLKQAELDTEVNPHE